MIRDDLKTNFGMFIRIRSDVLKDKLIQGCYPGFKSLKNRSVSYQKVKYMFIDLEDTASKKIERSQVGIIIQQTIEKASGISRGFCVSNSFWVVAL